MDQLAARLLDLYGTKATRRYGLSQVNQLQHALQGAAMAQAAGEPDAMVVATLLHDIGHMVHALGEDPARVGIDDRHEVLSAEWLSDFFGPQVTEPVRLHVQAKRYLCAIDPDYFSLLSDDSVRSLALQGGPMTPAEAQAFRQLEASDQAVRLRQYDDRAKDPQAVTPPFEHFLAVIDRVRLRPAP
jgi:phosphonate degradation associated HDIG domain protein